MRCFNHRDRDAVGICKACQKALCPDCANDLGHGIACRDKHESEVTAMHSLISRAMRAQSFSKRGHIATPLFYFALGGIFLLYGLTTERRLSLLVYLGGAMVAYGTFLFVANRRIIGKGRPDA